MRKMSIAAAIAAALLVCAQAAQTRAAVPHLVSYQGQLEVSGQPFTGSANFKFAIISDTLAGTITHWSNDNSSATGSQPTGSLTLPVQNGVFSVMLGDVDLGMVELMPHSFGATQNFDYRLRVWVDTGSGFEQLSDQILASSPFAMVADEARWSAQGFFTLQSDISALGGRIVGTDLNGYIDRVWLDGRTGLAHCDTLEFGDGTRMTTASQGGGGGDGDWNVSGANMSAAVAGNVGVGTTAPDRKLHVSGGSDIDSAFNGGYLRIGPTTTGNLLFDNNEIQAVNNGAANNLGINVEGGNVGIGTVNPSAKLQVIGSVRADGVGGFEARNPNNSGAISRLDWNADIARIRIGGSGAGALNGFDIQGISDASWLRILNNGNVGIGTVTPSQRLEVAGNAVITGNLTVQGSITGGGGGGGTAYLALGPAAFVEENANQTDFNRSTYIYGRTAGQRLNLHANVELPHGATITRCEVFCTDNEPTQSNGENVVFVLLREPFPSGTGAIISTQGTQNAPGDVTLDSGALATVVDNQNNYYNLTVYWDTPVAPRLITDMRLHGARITYTLP